MANKKTTERRRDDALRRALNTPPKQNKDLRKKAREETKDKPKSPRKA